MKTRCASGSATGEATLSSMSYLRVDGTIGQMGVVIFRFFFSSRRRHTRYIGDWSSDVCSSDLSVTAYVEWVLGVSRSAAAPFVVTEVDPTTRAMFARNTWSGEFGTRVAFADLGGAQTEWTGDRMEFLGRHGTLDRPAGLAGGSRLSGRVGAGFDPCSALRARVGLRAGGHVEAVCLLGQAAT